jgi:Hydrazine synthase alpha subunit middle domain
MARDSATVAAGPWCPLPTTRRRRPIGRIVILILMAALFHGGKARAQHPQAAPRIWPIVVTQLPAGSAAERQGARSSGMLKADYGAGARLVVVAPDGAVRVVSAGLQSACEADVSWDGQRLLFAGKRSVADPWNVFEVGVDGRGLRQVTRDLGDCRSPRYLSSFYTITENEPWDQVAFVVTRVGQRNEFGGAAATSLSTSKLDGSFVQRLTYNLSSDFDPALGRDGRLIYSTWHRATLDNGVKGRIALEGINTDGSDRAAFVPRGGRRVQHMPSVTPGGLAVFVESDSLPWDGAGTLASVELRRPLHTYRAITGPADGLFHSPSALPDGGMLVSWRPADGSGTLGVYRFDTATGQRDRVLDDPAYHETNARAVLARPRADGRSSVVSGLDPLAQLYCLNTYTTEFKDRSWLPPGTVKSLRVVEGVPATTGGAAEGTSGVPPLSTRRVLAEVPVKSDGSFHLIVPANTPVQLQILDDRGLALRSCGWIWARSHQAQGCIGCHEDPERTPDNRVPDALNDPGVAVTARSEKQVAVDFRREIAPIVSGRCVPCHGPGGSPPRLAEVEGPIDARSTETLKAIYEVLMTADPTAEAGSGTGKYVHPGRARTSPLVWHVLGRNTTRPWDGAATGGMVKPIPAGAVAVPTEAEIQALIRWIDLGAAWDARPQGDGQGIK